MRKRIVAGNWKMNLSKSEALELYDGLKNIQVSENMEVNVFAPHVYLDALNAVRNAVNVGAQNFYPEEKGAYTGEISTSHLKDLDVKHVLIGHSERRAILGEDNSFIKKKVSTAIEQNLSVTFCCGEPLEVREANKELNYVQGQLEDSLFQLSEDEMKKVTIAYEPIWAIGTGKTASVDQAQEMHHNIREALKQNFGAKVAENTSILYGGSCNPSNAKALFACEDIDGGLIGGASLKQDDFIQIISS